MWSVLKRYPEDGRGASIRSSCKGHPSRTGAMAADVDRHVVIGDSAPGRGGLSKFEMCEARPRSAICLPGRAWSVWEDHQLETLESEMVGVIFDGAGEALPPEHLAQQIGCQAGDTDVITYAVRTLGFVHVAPIRDALLVKFDPSTVLHLAALAALYKVVGQSPKRLVLGYPGQEGGLDQYQIFNSLIAGLKRVEAALNSTEDGIGPPPQPSEDFPASRRFCQLLGEQVSNRKPSLRSRGSL
jgi:hypothetical protein